MYIGITIVALQRALLKHLRATYLEADAWGTSHVQYCAGHSRVSPLSLHAFSIPSMLYKYRDTKESAMFWYVYGIALMATLGYVTCWYLFALYLRDNSIVDIAWGTMFILMAWISLWYAPVITWKSILVTAYVTIWGTRLSAHIYARHDGEDPRYAQWRRQWSYVKLRSFLQVFMLQGIVATIIAVPVIYINVSAAPLGWLDIFGSCVWCAGFACEAIADWQLQRFMASDHPEGAIMQSGLWRYSRHPNYFGESLIWWGIWIMSSPLPYGWACIISPILITYLILCVSGIPMNEAQFADNPQYQRYKERTSAFVPMPPSST